MSASNDAPLSVYKGLICDMIREEVDERFIRQIYSIVFRHHLATAVTTTNVATSKEAKE